MALTIDRAQVMAYRIAAQDLHRTSGDLADLAVLDLGVQDSQVSTARLALAARLDADPGTLDPASFAGTLAAAGVTPAWTHRGAPHLHRAADLDALASAMVPLNDADAQARLSWQRRDVEAAGMPTTEALTTAARALRDVVDSTMTKGAASERVTKVLPAGLTRWCRGCHATHIHEQLMRITTLRAGIRLEPDASPATLTPLNGAVLAETPDPKAGTRVVEQYLRLHGPATTAEAAGFIGSTRTVAAALWPEGLDEAVVDGRRTFLDPGHADALANPPEPDFVRLLPCWDPLLQSRDRLTLVPDKANHKAIWRIIGNPGVVLAHGEIVATWRARSKGKRLEITVAPLWTMPPATRSDVEAEAARVATARGFAGVSVAFE